jgi:type I restriction enzyme, S subunit
MEVTAGYKQTEIGMIPEDWDLKSIDTIAKIEGGGTPSTQIDEYWNGQIPWVSAGDISNAKGRYVKETGFFISELGLSNSPTKVLPKDTTIIIARGATVGRMAQLGKDMAFNQTCYCLLPNNGLDKNYLYYSMLFSVNSIIGMSYGTIFGTITTNSFRDWHIPLPPLAEQEAIAEALSDADALIEALEQLLAKKRQVKQGAMQELLTGNRRLPGFRDEWNKKTLGNICIIEKGQQLNRDTLSETDDYPVWNGGIEPSGFTNKWNTEAYTITISEGGNSCGFVNFIKQKFWRGGHCYALYKIENGVSKTYLYQYLKHREKDIMALRVGSGLPNVQRSRLSNFSVIYPSPEEQTAIAEILSDMDAEIAALEGKLTKARQVKQGMMQELLTGKVRLV